MIMLNSLFLRFYLQFVLLFYWNPVYVYNYVSEDFLSNFYWNIFLILNDENHSALQHNPKLGWFPDPLENVCHVSTFIGLTIVIGLAESESYVIRDQINQSVKSRF